MAKATPRARPTRTTLRPTGRVAFEITGPPLPPAAVMFDSRRSTEQACQPAPLRAGWRRRLDAAIGEREQQTHDDRVRQQRRAAVADEWQRDACERDQLQVAGGDNERLHAYHEAQ